MKHPSRRPALLVSLMLLCAGSSLSHALDTPFETQLRATTTHWSEPTPAAIHKAEDDNKPIFFFVGHFGSGLSRSMATETFANQSIATALNESAIPVLVDAHENPELASFLRQLAEDHFKANDWPICLWTTSRLEPINGGGYFPPTDDWGGQGFLSLARNVSEQWRARPDETKEAARARLQASLAAKAPLRPEALAEASAALRIEKLDTVTLDAAELLAALSADPSFADHVAATLATLATSAGFDAIDGGFFIGANDPGWKLPLFQKSTTDQALMLSLLGAMIQLQPKPEYSDMARLAQAFVENELLKANGLAIRYIDSFAPGETPETTEGSHYLFDTQRVAQASPEAQALWSLAPEGNLSEDIDALGLYEGFSIPTNQSLDTLSPASDPLRQELSSLRQSSPKPAREETGYTDANALLVSGLVAIHRASENNTALVLAQKIFRSILAHNLNPDGSLRHCDLSPAPASSTDYAFLVAAALDLFAVTQAPEFLAHAKSFDQQWRNDSRYPDPAQIAFRPLGSEITFLPLRDYDIPSPAAVQIANLRRLAAATGDATYAERAAATLAATQGSQEPATGNFLSLLALRMSE